MGPRDKLGEGSIALAKALGVNANPRRGGITQGIVYIVYTGSGNGRPRSLSDINTKGGRLFQDWGGMKRVAHLFHRGL